MDIELKKLTEVDLELVREWRNSEDVANYMYTDSHISSEDQVKWFHQLNKETTRYWLITYDNRKLGLAYITGISKSLSSCYWGFYIGDSSVRGAGIGAKVEFNVLEYVFNDLDLNKLRCEVFVQNDRVIKMHEKFGFRREAYYREHCFKGREKLDVVGLAMLKNDWKVLRDFQKTRIYGE